MAYTTLALVKSSLGIPDAVTSEDTAINAAIGAADASLRGPDHTQKNDGVPSGLCILAAHRSNRAQ